MKHPTTNSHEATSPADGESVAIGQLPGELGSEARWPVDSADRAREYCLEGIRVLLVDDSIDNRRLFQRILRGAQAAVDLATNGLEATELQLRAKYDIIIMDIRMPVLDGYEATRRIRAQGFVGPVIALTAHNTPGEERRCRDAGCSYFYLKPIDRLGLLRAVHSAVESSSSRAQ